MVTVVVALIVAAVIGSWLFLHYLNEDLKRDQEERLLMTGFEQDGAGGWFRPDLAAEETDEDGKET